MATLVFDIETVGEQWEELDAITRKTLTRWIDRTAQSEDERNARIADIKDGLGFSPLTGSVVSIAVFDLERKQGAVYFRGEREGVDYSADGFIYKVRNEAGILKDFWNGARSYDTFVTFNGRCFDVPFLYHRSVVHNITPSCHLLRRRYLAQQTPPYHIDLQDELTFYGAMQRRPSLHLFCRAYGIPSPKSDLTGDDVATLFRAGKCADIAHYNVQDVIATSELYKKWHNYLSPHAIQDVPEADIDIL